MNSSTSGWSQRSVAIIAPRRPPVASTVAHIEFHSRMNETGPEATEPDAVAGEPRGRSVEKSQPMPPPCCSVSADSSSARKMPAIESSMSPITKQLQSVTRRPVPAPARMRPPGRNAKSSSRAPNRRVHCRRRAAESSAAAIAQATRCQVCAMSVSRSAPPSRHW